MCVVVVVILAMKVNEFPKYHIFLRFNAYKQQ